MRNWPKLRALLDSNGKQQQQFSSSWAIFYPFSIFCFFLSNLVLIFVNLLITFYTLKAALCVCPRLYRLHSCSSSSSFCTASSVMFTSSSTIILSVLSVPPVLFLWLPFYLKTVRLCNVILRTERYSGDREYQESLKHKWNTVLLLTNWPSFLSKFTFSFLSLYYPPLLVP